MIKDGRIIISDRVEKLEETGAKKVILKGRLSEKLVNELKRLEKDVKNKGEKVDTTTGDHTGDYVTDLKIEADFATFLYNGYISRLLSVLAAEKLRDVSITEPTMEEIFMNYYE